MFYEKGVLRNVAKLTGKHLRQSLFLIKLQAKNTFFYRTPLVAAFRANLSKVMLVESFLIMCIICENYFFSSGKLDRSNYPQKLMLKYVNSKAEICKN